MFKAPTGTRDVIAPESRRWEALVAQFVDRVSRAGYGLVQSPMFEELGVFHRVGEGTDVVTKEMYDFEDKGGRRIALRPEGTASVVRAYNQHRPTPPWKAYYVAPSFRYERPQAGRYRQHHQVGVEVLGSADPDVDVETIVLLADFYRGLGLERFELLINNLGDPGDRSGYVDTLGRFLQDRLDEIDPADHHNVTAHPLRVLDSKRESTRAVTDAAPRMVDHCSPEATEHFERVLRGLESLGVAYQVDTRLVRGLDYYTRTTFEFQSTALEAAQNAIGGGGRYDGLAEALGGPATPGIGFGSGIERILLACDAEGVFDVPQPSAALFVIDTTGGAEARDLTHELRRAGLGADRAFDQRSMKAQMKAADRSGATYALIVGPDEQASASVTIRDLRGGQEQRTVARTEVVDTARSLLAVGGSPASSLGGSRNEP